MLMLFVSLAIKELSVPTGRLRQQEINLSSVGLCDGIGVEHTLPFTSGIAYRIAVEHTPPPHWPITPAGTVPFKERRKKKEGGGGLGGRL